MSLENVAIPYKSGKYSNMFEKIENFIAGNGYGRNPL